MLLSYEPLEKLTIVERVKLLCDAKGISIAKLERECGFANGYIGKLKEGTMPADRLGKVAKYLDEPVEVLVYGLMFNRENETVLERDIVREMNKLNEDGQQKVLEYMLMLSRLPEYQKHQELSASNVG